MVWRIKKSKNTAPKKKKKKGILNNSVMGLYLQEFGFLEMSSDFVPANSLVVPAECDLGREGSSRPFILLGPLKAHGGKYWAWAEIGFGTGFFQR